MTFPCDECGKTLATEGGLAVHMQTHGAAAPEPLEVIDVLEALPVDAPAPRPSSPPRLDLVNAVPAARLVSALAVATLVIFLMGTTVAVRPSLIRNNNHRATVVATEKAHGVAIPDASTPAAAAPTPTTAAAPATAPTPTVPAVRTASDSTRVRSLVLQLADYGPGWHLDASAGDDNSSDAGDQAFDSDIDACLSDFQTIDSTADAGGPDVANGDLSAATSANVYSTPALAAADLNQVNDPRLIPCVKSAINKGLQAEGVPAGAVSVDVQRLNVPVAKAHTAGIRMSISASGPGGTMSFTSDILGVQVGRTESILMLSCEGDAIPASVEQALAARLAAKQLGFDQVSA